MFNLFLIILAWLVFVYFSQRKIIWGLGIIVLLLPSYLWRFKIFGLPSTFLELMILSLLFIWFIREKPYQKVFWQKNFALQKKWFYLLLAWLLISVLALFFNSTFSALGLWRAYFFEPILFFIILFSSLKSNEDRQLLISSLAGLVFYLSIFAVVQNFTYFNLPPAYDGYNDVKRLTSVFSYPNALALLSAPIAAFLVAYYFFSRKKQWEYLFIGLLASFLSWWSLSQGALVALGIAFCTAFFAFVYRHYFSKKNKYIFWSILFLLLLGLFFSPVSQSIQQQIFHPQLNSTSATSLEIRSNQWSETWSMLGDNWFTGAGLAAYSDKMVFYHQILWIEVFLYPHNIFLNFWVELGLLGLLCFLLIMFFIAKEIKKLFINKDELAWPLMLFWLVWFVHGLVDVPYFKNDLSILFFIFLALTLKARDYDLDLQQS